MKLAVVADVHLDTKFSWLTARAAARRRENLKKALERAVELVVAEKADALLVAGDLYEQDRFAADTGQFLSRVFESLEPRPVLVAPGNHDWWGPESLYALVAWSPNVHVFKGSSLEPFELEDGVTVWGAAHQASRTERNFLDNFRVPGSGVHIGLIHGSESSRLRAEILADPNKFAHAPFAESDICRAGLAHVFAGHYHTASSSSLCTYPGNPDPLNFGEDRLGNPRGVVFATIDPSGGVRVEPAREVAVSRVLAIDVDIGGAGDRRQLVDVVVERVHEAIQGAVEGSFLKISLGGEVARDVDLTSIENSISDELAEASAVVVEADRVRHSIDIEAFEDEQSIRGEFVRAVAACDDLDDRLKEKVIVAGLTALEGRDELL